MNLNDLKASGTNQIELNDSLETSLLSLKISLNESTQIPSNNELTIYVDTSSTPTENRKTYTFQLDNALSIEDEFIMEPVITDKNIELKAYVKRSTNDIEEVEYQNILLFAGTNHIYTNYENATIDIMYPKNNDLVRYYLNNILYSLNNKNKILSLDDIYFKDAFTKVDDKLNATLNNLSIDCLTSNNNKFSLDSDGNLTVNSLTTSISSSNTNFDEIYPVGSIYMSVNNTNPSTLFGGTWEQIIGRFLWATNNTPGLTGGSRTHTLTVEEMPAHAHQYWTNTASTSTSGMAENLGWANTSAQLYLRNIAIQSSGGGKAHNNMPPYLEVYIWKRIS